MQNTDGRCVLLSEPGEAPDQRFRDTGPTSSTRKRRGRRHFFLSPKLRGSKCEGAISQPVGQRERGIEMLEAATREEIHDPYMMGAVAESFEGKTGASR